MYSRLTLRWERDNIIFDSLHEADVWADSIGNEIYSRVYDGYDTLDYKVACALAFRLANMKEFKVFSETTTENRYKVWVVPS